MEKLLLNKEFLENFVMVFGAYSVVIAVVVTVFVMKNMFFKKRQLEINAEILGKIKMNKQLHHKFKDEVNKELGQIDGKIDAKVEKEGDELKAMANKIEDNLSKRLDDSMKAQDKRIDDLLRK